VMPSPFNTSPGMSPARVSATGRIADSFNDHSRSVQS
jgi:hypothetical protein